MKWVGAVSLMEIFIHSWERVVVAFFNQGFDFKPKEFQESLVLLDVSWVYDFVLGSIIEEYFLLIEIQKIGDLT